jgi:hypothetical protein
MPPRVGDIIKQARQAWRLTLRRLADHVMMEDATPISPQYLFDMTRYWLYPVGGCGCARMPLASS